MKAFSLSRKQLKLSSCSYKIKKRPWNILSPTILILMDQAASHKLEVANTLQNYEQLLVPAGCTSLVQPLDVLINEAF